MSGSRTLIDDGHSHCQTSDIVVGRRYSWARTVQPHVWLQFSHKNMLSCLYRKSRITLTWCLAPVMSWVQNMCQHISDPAMLVANNSDFLYFSACYICMSVFRITTDQHSLLHALKVKGLDIYILPLTGKPRLAAVCNWSGVLTGIDTSGAAQVATAHCPNERTLDPAVCS